VGGLKVHTSDTENIKSIPSDKRKISKVYHATRGLKGTHKRQGEYQEYTTRQVASKVHTSDKSPQKYTQRPEHQKRSKTDQKEIKKSPKRLKKAPKKRRKEPQKSPQSGVARNL
jgi:hypothetical protein